MKCEQFRSGFELWSLIPFPASVLVTLSTLLIRKCKPTWNFSIRWIIFYLLFNNGHSTLLHFHVDAISWLIDWFKGHVNSLWVILKDFIHMCVRVFLYMYITVNVRVCIYIYIYIYIYVCVYTYIYVYIYTDVSIYIYIFTSLSARAGCDTRSILSQV